MGAELVRYQNTFNRVVDKLFKDILADEQPDLSYFQAKIDLIAEKFTNDVGHHVYKLYICQAIIQFYRQEFAAVINTLERADEIRGGKAVDRDFEKVKNYLTSQSHVVMGKLQVTIDEQALTDEVGKGAAKAFAYGIALLVLGGIITGVSYSETDPGGTYTMTTGLFVIGGAYCCVGVYRTLRWIVRKTS